MFVTSYSVTYCIYIPGKPGFCFHYYCADYDEYKYSDAFKLADRVRLFVHGTISLSSLWKLIWGHWTDEMPVRYILSSVWVRLSMFSQLSIIQYMGLCVFSLPISLVMIERIYTLSYHHHQIGSMNYYPLFRVRSWNNGMRCMSLFLWHKLTNQLCILTPPWWPEKPLDSSRIIGFTSEIYLNHLWAELCWRGIAYSYLAFSQFSIIHWHWDRGGSWYPLSQKTRTRLAYIVSTITNVEHGDTRSQGICRHSLDPIPISKLMIYPTFANFIFSIVLFCDIGSIWIILHSTSREG